MCINGTFIVKYLNWLLFWYFIVFYQGNREYKKQIHYPALMLLYLC